MLNVVTVNWRNYEGRGVEYTNILYDSVRRNLEGGVPGRFIVFTDDPTGYDDGIETRPLPIHLEGWWTKLSLFRPHLFPAGDRVLYLDLDTVITGSIDALAAYDGDFGILADFYRPLGLQSSVMAWEAGKHTRIWESYEKAGCPMDDPGGDQAWIEKNYQAKRERLQVRFPGMFVSYKKSGGVIPDRASVVVFHGRPRPHEITDGWVPQIWCKDGLSHSELTAVCNTAHDALMANVKSSVARDLDWFRVRDANDKHVAIIGGGPSVLDMIEEIKWRQSQGQHIWFLNNAARVLGSVHADAQVILDARPENQEFITSADEYLIASQCDPGIFDVLEGANVTLWHVNTPGMTELLKGEKERYAYLIGGGTTVGMNAIALAYCRGYRKIHLYGFDSSYRGCQHHAYAQPLNDNERTTTVLYGGKTYTCAPWMASQAQEFIELSTGYEGAVITVHGSGLLPDIARDMMQDHDGDTKTVGGLMWPRNDFECAKVVFDISALDVAYKYCDDFSVCVQAGGNCGVWPKALAGKFETVYTFEPDALNFECLSHNASAANIIRFNAALGSNNDPVDLDRSHLNNCGAYQVIQGGSIPTMRIDDLGLERCGLIYLDIEGFEFDALNGAADTIQRLRPVIAFEDKGLSERYGVAQGHIENWLEQFDYRVAERVGRDVIMISTHRR